MDYAALIAGILAFVIALPTLVFTIKTFFVTNHITLVVNKREEWKEKLRAEATNFCLTANALINKQNPNNFNINDINKSRITIELMLNINDKIDNVIKKLIQEIGEGLEEDKDGEKRDRTVLKESLNSKLTIVKNYFQIYLKTEWERIKYYSKKKTEKNFDFNKKAQEYYNEIGTEKFIGYEIDWTDKIIK